MRMNRVLAMFFVMALATTAALSVQTKGPSGYTIDAPKGWKVTANPGGIPELLVVGPRAAGFAPNLNVVVSAAPAGVTLAQIRSASPQMLKAMFTGWRALASGETTLAGVKATYLEHTAQMGNPKRTLWLRQVMVVRRGKVITFTCTAPPSGRAALAKTFTAMMKSIRWN